MARVNVIYHHFPHYRAPVMRALTRNGRHDYRFWGDLLDRDGILAFAGDDVVHINPLRFVFDDRGNVDIRGYWPAISDPTADALIIIGNPNMHATWLMAIAGRAMGKKVLFWAHGWRRTEPFLKQRLRNFYYGLADRVLVYGNRAVQLAGRSGFPQGRIEVIYNSLDWERSRALAVQEEEVDRDALRRELGLDPDCPVLLCTARLTAECRFDLLLAAASHLAATGTRCQVVLVGDGPERQRLAALATSLSVEVHFAGAIYDEAALVPYFHAADVTVSPGKVGLTAIHSMTYGVPVITHDNLDEQMPEVEAIAPGVTGELFRQDSLEDLCRAIRAWVDPHRSRAETAAACIARIAEHYTPQAQTERIDAAIDGVLDGRR